MEVKAYHYGEWSFFIGDRIEAENRRQRVYLEPRHHYWRKHLNFVRALIEMGEIQNYDDLCRYCNGKISIQYCHKQPKRQLIYE